MWECSWKLNATSFHCTFQTCVITKLLRTQEIITFSLNFFRTTQCWTERKIYKGMKKYRLKNLIKEQHKRELKIPGNYCQPGLLWTSNYLISPQSHRIINYTAQNNKMSRQITKPHITYSLKKKIFFKLCVCILRLLHHSLEGLQDHVGLVDEPVGADKHVYHFSIFEVGFESVTEALGVFHKLFLLLFQCPSILILVFPEDSINCV